MAITPAMKPMMIVQIMCHMEAVLSVLSKIGLGRVAEGKQDMVRVMQGKDRNAATESRKKSVPATLYGRRLNGTAATSAGPG